MSRSAYDPNLVDEIEQIINERDQLKAEVAEFHDKGMLIYGRKIEVLRKTAGRYREALDRLIAIKKDPNLGTVERYEALDEAMDRLVASDGTSAREGSTTDGA